MGVQGLNKFVDAHPELTREYELSEQKVVIDGSSLVHFLYTQSEADFIFGGDYKVFANYILFYIECLRECGVRPIIVFDGGLDKSENMFKKRKRSHEQRLEKVYKYIENFADGDKDTLLPILACEVFKIVLSETDVRIIQCEFKEDSSIAALANNYECPVLSRDSDFHIFHLKYGFIRLENLETTVQIKPNGRRFLKCKIFHLNLFISYYHLKDVNLMPLFAALLSFQNEPEYAIDGKHFFHKLRVKRYNERIPKLLRWLKQYTLNNARNTFFKMIRGDRRSYVKKWLRICMDNYNLKHETNLKYVVEYKNDEIIRKSKLSTHCGAKLPDMFILRFHDGLPSSLWTILSRNCQFLSPLIEDFSVESSHGCSRYIRAATRGVLLQHEEGTSKSHAIKCLKNVNEYDRFPFTDKVKITPVDPVTELRNGLKVPKLSDIYRMDKSKLKEFIRNVLGEEEALFNHLPSGLELFFYCINYWLRNSDPKPDENLVSSTLLCVIYLQVNRVSLGNSPFKEDLLFPNTHESNVRNFDMYIQRPTEKPYDLRIIHCYNQLQVCVLDTIQLNWLTESPFKSPIPHEIICGTLFYNLTKALQYGNNSEDLIKYLLGNNVDLTAWFFQRRFELLGMQKRNY